MMLSVFRNNSLGYGIAVFSGMLLTFAFYPFNLFLLAILSPAIILLSWINVSPSVAFQRGYLYGLGFFSTSIYWIFTSIHTYGNASTSIAVLITLSFILTLAFFPAFTGYCLNRFFPHPNAAKILLAFPVIWVLIEWVRSWIFSGFPWLLLGTSQVDSALGSYAPVGSVYSVSLVTLLSSALLVMWFNALTHRHRKFYKFFCPAALACIWITGAILCNLTWTKPFGKPITASLVQGNIQQELKWSSDYIQTTLDKYIRLTDQHWESDIIIWPESAIPIPLDAAKEFIRRIDKKAASHKSGLITGIPLRANQDAYYNGVIALGEAEGVYAKRRLVPFGEYIPLNRLTGQLFAFLNIPMSNFIPGNLATKPIKVGKINIATFICYEITYPELVNFTQEDISMMVTLSNDAWFGESIAQAQHLQMARMRAQEMQRPILFVSNTGITAVITHNGNIQSQIAPYKAAVLTDLVQPMIGKTPWQRFGLDPVLAVLLVMLYYAIRMRKNNV